MKTTEQALILIQHVSKRFGTHQAVDDVSLEIHSGQIFGIIGPNGAGKSTLFRMICRIIPPDAGSITVNGETKELEVKRQVGYLPEEHHLYEHMKAKDYLHYFCDLLGVPRTRTRVILAQIGLEEKADAKISNLSKGMRQKLSFGRTLVGDPAVLVLDEPTYGLDPKTSKEMRGWIRREALNKTVLLSSHNLHEAERSCDQVAVLHRGRVAALGAPADLIEAMKTEHIIEVGFLGSEAPIQRATQTLTTSRPPVIEPGLVRLYFPTSQNPYEILQAILAAIQNAPEPIAITGITPREPTLEDVFLKVTGELYEEADKGSADLDNDAEDP